MKIDEMIDRLREVQDYTLFPSNLTATFYGKVADTLEQYVRRETPMQVRVTTSTKRCPSCNKQVSGIGNIHRNYRYCRWCGQALDWTEE